MHFHWYFVETLGIVYLISKYGADVTFFLR